MSDLRPLTRPRPQRPRRAAPVVLVGAAALALVALVWALLVARTWWASWTALGGDEVSVLREDVLTLGPGGASGPRDATTLLVALTEPMDATVPRPPALAGPVLLVQVGGGRSLPAVLALPAALTVSVDGLGPLTLDQVQREGGIDLLVRSVMDYSEVRIDHAVGLSVELLPGLLRELGPLEVCGAQGCAVRSPDEVRAWQRDEDVERMVTRSADALRAVATAIRPGAVVASPLAARRAVRLLDEQLVTDVSLRAGPLLRLAALLSEPTRLDVQQLPVVVNPSTGTAVVLEEAAMLRFQLLRQGRSFDAIDPTQDVARLKAAVTVAVLNGIGVDGLAARIAADLGGEGFQVVGTGNSPQPDGTPTTLSFLAGDADAEQLALLLVELMPEAVLQPVERAPTFEGAAVPLVVTIGADLLDGLRVPDAGR